jgi:hypothetical protein
MDIQQRHNGKRVVFSEASFQKIRLLIRDFLLRSRASMCIFADVNGYPIAYGGDSRGVQISSLTALAAGVFPPLSKWRAGWVKNSGFDLSIMKALIATSIFRISAITI